VDQQRWQRVTVLFHSALEQEPEKRPAFLDHACGGDTDLRHQVELLLAREQEAGSFMETPAAHHRFMPNPCRSPITSSARKKLTSQRMKANNQDTC
jgi:hypothetical protein